MSTTNRNLPNPKPHAGVHSLTADTSNQLLPDSIRSEVIPKRLLATLTVSVFVAEALIMVMLWMLPPMPVWMTVLTDSTLIVICVLPGLYLFMFRPMVAEVNARKLAYGRLKEEHDQAQRHLDISGALIVGTGLHP